MRFDTVAFVLLVLLAILIRVPMVGKWGNSDEAWYAAIAAYNSSYARSPFESPGNNASPTIAIYQCLSTLGGSYNKVAVDAFTLIICVGIAIWIYGVLRNVSGPWTAFLAATSFLVTQSLWEGLTSNREWYAVPLLVIASHLLYQGLGGVQPGSIASTFYVALSAIFVACATGMKEQSLPFVVLGPAVIIVCFALGVIHFRHACKLLGLNLGSFLLGMSLVLLPHAYYGTASNYFTDMWNRIALEGAQNMAASVPSYSYLLRKYIAGVALTTEGRSVLLSWALLSACYQVYSLIGRRRNGETPVLAYVFTLSYLCSLLSLAGGGRFFDHYYLFMLPFAVPLVAITLHEICGQRDRAYLLLSPFVVVAAAQSLWGMTRGTAADRLDVAVSLMAALSVYCVIFMYVRTSNRPSGGRLHLRCRQISIITMIVCLTVIASQRQIRRWPSDDLAIQSHTKGILEAVAARRKAGDQIFVWGWQTRLYPASKMAPGCQFVSVARVVHDFEKGQVLPDIMHATPEMRQMIRELEVNRPRFLVDASRNSYTLSDVRIYEIRRHPEFASFLASNYVRSGSYGEYVLYVRRDGV